MKQELMHELAILSLFDQATLQEGLKVHEHKASAEHIDATRRLHQKGLLTQTDGGYLTTLGTEAVEHLQGLMLMLKQFNIALIKKTGLGRFFYGYKDLLDFVT